MTDLEPGTVVAGKFRIERVIGEGGMGVVLAAHHLLLGRTVAIKLLKPAALAHPDIVTRFGNEARSASRIQSEHVARVLDVGALDSGEPYMVMEYLDGSDLLKYARQRGPLGIEEAVDYLLQACEALAEAHVAGIVHRDLKPANLFLTRRADGSACVKVLDFGISKAALGADEAGAQNLTQTSSVLGTPGYMAPEQLRSSKHVDARTDIWALGVIFHQLLTGKMAFQGSTVADVYAAILTSPPEPLRSSRPDAPAEIEAIIGKCLEKDPNHRFANVGEFAAAIGRFAPTGGRLSVERIGRITGVSTPSQSQSVIVSQASAMAYGPVHTSEPTVASQGAPMPAMYAPQGQTPQQAYGASGQTPQQGYRMQAPGSAYPHAGGSPQYPTPMQYPAQSMAPQAPEKSKMHPSTIALIAILGVVVVTFGGCLSCLCVAGSGSEPNTYEQPAQP